MQHLIFVIVVPSMSMCYIHNTNRYDVGSVFVLGSEPIIYINAYE